MNVLSNEVKSALTIEATTAWVESLGRSIDNVMLKDVEASVLAIDEGAFPKQKSFHLVGNELVSMFRKMFEDCEHIKPGTLANKYSMVRNAANASLARRESAISAFAIAMQADALAKDKPTKVNQAKAVKANAKADKALDAADNAPTSLDKASKAGIAVARLKSSRIKVRQVKAKAVKAPKPTKLAEQAAKEKRTAKSELFLQAIDASRALFKADGTIKVNVKPEMMGLALAALVSASSMVIPYLPEDMRTL